jgi:hypothetical protein
VGSLHEIGRITKLEWNLDPKDAAHTRETVDADLPTHCVHKSFADRQTKPATAKPAGCRAVRLSECRKELGLLFQGNANPGIAHLNAEAQPILCCRSVGDVERDAAFLGELDRIADQVEEDLRQTGWVSSENRWRVLGQLEAKL